MEELIETNRLIWNGYETEFLTEKELHENILFQIPETKEHKNYKMIYSHLVEFYPHNYLEKSELAKKHSIDEKDIIAEGSVKLMDTSRQNPPLVRWLIVKD
jgi:hypothetical protein